MQLTHFDENGKAIMVDVTEKNDTVREATAKGRILVSKEVYDAIEAGTVGFRCAIFFQSQNAV